MLAYGYWGYPPPKSAPRTINKNGYGPNYKAWHRDDPGYSWSALNENGLWKRQRCMERTAASIASACVIYKIVSPRLPRRTGRGKWSRRPERGGVKGRDPQGRDGQSSGCLQGTGSLSQGNAGRQPAGKREAAWGGTCT